MVSSSLCMREGWEPPDSNDVRCQPLSRPEVFYSHAYTLEPHLSDETSERRVSPPTRAVLLRASAVTSSFPLFSDTRVSAQHGVSIAD